MRRASWVYQGSFSKTVAPGLRLGFLTASEDLFPHLVRLKQAADLHTSRLSQWIVQRLLDDPGRPARLRGLVDRYRHRRDLFATAIARHLEGLVDWELPPGGMFFWATLKAPADVLALAHRAAARNVLFTPGEHFLAVPAAGSTSTLRLNFSHADDATADRGLAVLAGLLREHS